MISQDYILLKPESGEPVRGMRFNSKLDVEYSTMANGLLTDDRLFPRVEFYDYSTASRQPDGRYRHDDTGEYFTVVSDYTDL